MKKGDPVGTPIEKGPWKRGTWVWHVRTRRGPLVVVEDQGGDLVYVDTKPNRPASKNRGYDVDHKKHSRHFVSFKHGDVEHHYRSMLTDIEPPKRPSLLTLVNWDKFGKGIGVGFGFVFLGLLFLFFMWLDSGAPGAG